MIDILLYPTLLIYVPENDNEGNPIRQEVFRLLESFCLVVAGGAHWGERVHGNYLGNLGIDHEVCKVMYVKFETVTQFVCLFWFLQTFCAILNQEVLFCRIPDVGALQIYPVDPSAVRAVRSEIFYQLEQMELFSKKPPHRIRKDELHLGETA